MGKKVYYLDFGNTAVKFATRMGDQWSIALRHRYEDDASSLLDALNIKSEEVVFCVASVVDTENVRRIVHVLEALGRGVSFKYCESRRSVGSIWRTRYEIAESLGLDRMLGMLGALTEVRGAFCVVDAGTATTFDVVNDEGTHLGGYIIPGLELAERALFSGTKGIPESRNIEMAIEPGLSTAEAVHRGCLAMQVGTIRYLFLEESRRLQDTCKLILTGGNAGRLSALLGVPHLVDEHLVFKGMEQYLARP